MTAATATYNDATADQLRLEMAMVRKDLGADIKGVAAQARELTDWRQYVKRAPWISVAVATAAGFMVVPRKLNLETVDPNTIAKLAEQHRIVVENKPKAAAKAGVGSSAFAVISAIVLRSAMGFASQKVSELLASKQSDGSGTAQSKSGNTQ